MTQRWKIIINLFILFVIFMMLEKKKRQNLSLQWQHLAQWRGNEKWNILKNRTGQGLLREGSEQPIVMWWEMPGSIEMLILTQKPISATSGYSFPNTPSRQLVTVPWMMISFSCISIYGNKVIKRNVFSVNTDAVILGYQCSLEIIFWHIIFPSNSLAGHVYQNHLAWLPQSPNNFWLGKDHWKE